MSSLKIKEHNNMKDQKLEINFRSCLLDELNADEQELVRAAMQATSNSYAKYSHFCVGAAVRLADGKIVIGANQENAAFPLDYVQNVLRYLQLNLNILIKQSCNWQSLQETQMAFWIRRLLLVEPVDKL